jgi:hypothetical protein
VESGRYEGRSDPWQLELRLEVGDARTALSGDLYEGPSRTPRVSFVSFTASPPGPAGELAAPVALVSPPGAAGADSARGAGSVVLRKAAPGLAAQLEAGAAGVPALPVFALARAGPEYRRARLLSYLCPGTRAPDDPGLAPVQEPGPAAAPVTLASAFARAGLTLDAAPPLPLPDAGAGPNSQWSDAELAAALAALRPAPPPPPGEPWPLHLVVATRSERPAALGVLFEPGAAGEGRAAAVFHDAVRDQPKVRGDPALFARDYLFACAHELGHVLRLPHVFEPFRSAAGRDNQAFSFMAYPDLYAFGYTHFFEEFDFRFRPEELAHLRHAPWPEVWPGAPGGPDGHPLLESVLEPDPDLRLELRLHGARGLPLGAPVHLEVKLWNEGARRRTVPAGLAELESGSLRVAIEGPGGWGPQPFLPLRRRDDPSVVRLEPRTRGRGRSALYATLDLTYGAGGFPFAEPGSYRVYAEVLSERGSVVAAPPLSLLVEGSGAERARFDELAEGPSGRAVGRALVLGLDPASEARVRLEALAREREPAGLSSWAAYRVGEAMARPFKRVGGEVAEADPEAALHWLERAAQPASGERPLAKMLRARANVLRIHCFDALEAPRRAARERQALTGLLGELMPDNAALRRRAERDWLELRAHWRRPLEGGDR